MNKNTTIFLGLLLVGGAAFYFVSSTKGGNGTDEEFIPPDTATTKSNPIRIATNVAQALKDNENPFIYNGKIAYLNNLLQLGVQLVLNRYTTGNLARFYQIWKKQKSVQPLPYGDVNKGNVDKYIYDLLLAGKETRLKLA